MHASPPSSQSPWMPFESRRRARDEKREAVLRTAVQLFLEQGYHGTTLNDVADRLNITKPALYNYFRGKDEILFECWALGAGTRRRTASRKSTAAAAPGSPSCASWFIAYAEVMTTDYGASLVRFDPRDLTEQNRKIVRAAKKQHRPDFPRISRRRYRRRLDQAVRCRSWRRLRSRAR